MQAEELIHAVDGSPLAHPVRIAELARRHGVLLTDLFRAAGVGAGLSSQAILSADLEIKYHGYFERERSQAERMRTMGDFPLLPDLPYGEMHSLSFEARQKLASIQPRTLAQAARIPGVSPSDIQNLVIEVERKRRAAVPA